MKQIKVYLFLVLCIQFFSLAEVTAQSAYGRPESRDRFPGRSWDALSVSEKAGWSKEKLAAAQAYANADSIRTSAVMIVQVLTNLTG
jgi:hypothetical protein